MLPASPCGAQNRNNIRITYTFSLKFEFTRTGVYCARLPPHAPANMDEVRSAVRTALLATQPVVLHTAHFNDLLRSWLPSMIREHVAIDTIYEGGEGGRYRYVVHVDNYRCVRQHVSPDECHLRNMNYASDIVIDVHMAVYQLASAKRCAQYLEQHQPPPAMEKRDRTWGGQPSGKRRRTGVATPLPKRGLRTKVGSKLPEKRTFEEEGLIRRLDEEERVLVHTEDLLNHILVSFPNMLHSVGCKLSDACGTQTRLQKEMGGSFVLRGKRRFVPFMERLQHNLPFFFRIKGKHLVEIRSEHLDRRFRSTSTLNVVLNPSVRGKHVGHSKMIHVCIPFLEPPVPLHVLVLAFGWSFERFERCMYTMATEPERLRSHAAPYMNRMRFAHHGCTTRTEALLFVAHLYGRYDACQRKLMQSMENVLHSEVLPHLNHRYEGDDELGRTWNLKMQYLAWLCGMLFRFGSGEVRETQRDSYAHLVVDGAAELIAQLFRQILREFTKQAIKTMRRGLAMCPTKPKRGAHPAPSRDDRSVAPYRKFTLSKVFNRDRLTPRIMSALSTGRWSDQKRGVSHSMRTINPTIILSQLRRLSSSYLSNQGRHVGPRMVHPSSYGYVCPAETPEGEACGLVYTLAMTAQITDASDPEVLTELLTDGVLRDLFIPLSDGVVEGGGVSDAWWKLVGPQGMLCGWLTDAGEALRRVRTMRRQQGIDAHVSVHANEGHHTVYVLASAGRLTRPLIVLENVHALYGLVRRWGGRDHAGVLLGTLFAHGVVEYVDVAEGCAGGGQVHVAFGPRDVTPHHTHMEVTDAAFVGICASYLPYFRNNQGPRTVYQIGMQKQWISPMALDDYGANKTHTLHHGQRPLVTTATERHDQCDGLNVVLALYPDEDAQEDALVMKRGFAERGGFVSATRQTHTATHTPRSANHDQDRFERPGDKTFGLKVNVDYSKIGPDGMPPRGLRIHPGDVIIGRTIPHEHISMSAKVKVPAECRETSYAAYRRDASVYAKKSEGGVVGDIYEGPGIRKVPVVTQRPTEQGDKFSNRHGQKGTAGRIRDDVDMPFCERTGMIPDIVVGPTALPSRMTMGMLIEMLVGKAVAASGCIELGVDPQSFEDGITEKSIEAVGRVLRRLGFKGNGRERMRDGRTGELLRAEIFIGPIFYGKMVHMVADKVHPRAGGARQPITRQPTEGRRNNGGFRLGGMEIHVLGSHGASAVGRERTCKVSDEVKIYRCKQCGLVGDGNAAIDLFVCRVCKTSEHMRTLRQSNSTNVMLTELACSGIASKLLLRDVDEAVAAE